MLATGWARVEIEPTLAAWRAAARPLLAGRVEPGRVMFTDGLGEEGGRGVQGLLMAEGWAAAPATCQGASGGEGGEGGVGGVRVPQAFFERAATVAAHRDAGRWDLLYRLAFRLAYGEPRLLEDVVDADVRRMMVMEKQVGRDIHKSHAFVRFTKVGGEEEGERFVAFYRPDHRILRLTVPFFVERFGGGAMKWSILTPDECAHWDGVGGKHVSYTEGVAASEVSTGDDLVAMWQTYYAHIFNPARIKLGAMYKEMPRRFWKQMPETELIDDLLAAAPQRVAKMLEHRVVDHPGAGGFLPPADARGRRELPQLREAIAACRGCPICPMATAGGGGPVFGEGPVDGGGARIMLVGEQPGDVEDREGVPFVGPAGKVLDRALAMAGGVGLPRNALYVTNAVKGFKYERRGADGGVRRIHAKPDSREIHACRPWLAAEIAAVRPGVIVALGNTAAHSLLGPTVKVGRHRGQVLPHESGAKVLVTHHPAAILRVPNEAAAATMLRELAEDLATAAGVAARAVSD